MLGGQRVRVHLKTLLESRLSCQRRGLVELDSDHSYLLTRGPSCQAGLGSSFPKEPSDSKQMDPRLGYSLLLVITGALFSNHGANSPVPRMALPLASETVNHGIAGVF